MPFSISLSLLFCLTVCVCLVLVLYLQQPTDLLLKRFSYFNFFSFSLSFLLANIFFYHFFFCFVLNTFRNLSHDNIITTEFIDYHMLDSVVYSIGAKTGMYNTWDHGESLGVMMNANGKISFQLCFILTPLSAVAIIKSVYM